MAKNWSLAATETMVARAIRIYSLPIGLIDAS
jgi:hypothetical protein